MTEPRPDQQERDKPRTGEQPEPSDFAEDNSDDSLALGYVLGELTSEETAEFEGRLEEDQALREAVANAAGLMELIWQAEAEADVDADAHATLPSSEPVVRVAAVDGGEIVRRWMLTGVAVAASLCVAVVAGGNTFWANWLRVSPSREQAGSKASDHGAANSGSAMPSGDVRGISREMAFRWAAMNDVLTPDATEGDAAFDESLDDLLGDDASFPDASLDRLQTPSWMLAGIAHLSDNEVEE